MTPKAKKRSYKPRKRPVIDRINTVTKGKINALMAERDKILDTLLDAGSKVRIEKELESFVDAILKIQPGQKQDKEEDPET